MLRLIILVAVAILLLGPVAAKPVRASPCAAGQLTGAAAVQSGWADDKPGLCRRITPADLPAVAPSKTSYSRIVPLPAGTVPRVPKGFKVERFFRGGNTPRLIRTAPNGDIFVAESDTGTIRVLRPSDVCKLGTSSTFTTGLDRPFGTAFYPPGPNPKWVYVGDSGAVVRYPYSNGDLAASGSKQSIVSLPAGAGQLPGKGHKSRDVVFSPDGSNMYVSIGSYSNVAQEKGVDETGRAMVVAYKPDGTGRREVATGLRNPVTLAIWPRNGQLWSTVNERDGLGDNQVPDYVTPLKRGGFYGWPWYYLGNHVDGRPSIPKPADLPPVTVPSVLLQAHSAALGSAFYTGTQFPKEYQGSLFVATHGSWNRSNPTGSKVIRILFAPEGYPRAYYEDFMTGFVVANHDVWGRPVGVTVGAGGSLYVSEDANRAIYCVHWTGG